MYKGVCHQAQALVRNLTLKGVCQLAQALAFRDASDGDMLRDEEEVYWRSARSEVFRSQT